MSDVIQFSVSIEQRQVFDTFINQQTLTDVYLNQLKSYTTSIERGFATDIHIQQTFNQDKEL